MALAIVTVHLEGWGLLLEDLSDVELGGAVTEGDVSCSCQGLDVIQLFDLFAAEKLLFHLSVDLDQDLEVAEDLGDVPRCDHLLVPDRLQKDVCEDGEISDVIELSINDFSEDIDARIFGELLGLERRRDGLVQGRLWRS